MSYKQYRSAARDLISYVYHHGYKIRVDMNMDWDMAPDYEFPRNASEAWEMVNAADGGENFSIVSGDKPGDKYIGTVVLAIGYNDPEEEVVDYTVCEFIDEWFNDFIERY